MDLERSLPDALDGLIPEPPTQLLPAELTALARRRVRRQRALAAAGTVAVVALASVAVASYQPKPRSSPDASSVISSSATPAPSPALNGHTCSATPPPTTDDQGRPIAKLAADLDGDGKPDQVVTYLGPTGGVYQAVLGNGKTTDPQTVEDVFPLEGGGAELLGVHDFDGDGKAEVLVRSGGNTGDVGGVVRLDGCRFTAVGGGQADAFSFSYGAHSNCCPDVRVLVTCDGSNLIETTSQPDTTAAKYAVMSDAERARLRRTWERNVYQVGARSAHRISHTTGRTKPGEDVIPEGQSGVRC